MRVWHVTLVVLILVTCIPAYSEQKQIVYSFASQGREYQVAFVDSPRQSLFVDAGWCSDLVLRWRRSKKVVWHTIARIRDVHFEKSVRIQRNGIHDALVISSPGASSQNIHVVEIDRNPAGLRVLLRDELDKGGFDYLYDSKGLLSGFEFHYMMWHVEPDEVERNGHVFTCRELKWSPEREAFVGGKVEIDHKREKESDLLGLLRAIGSDELLPVTVLYRKQYVEVLAYRPIGILEDKTPKSLRSCEYVRVVVRHSADWHNDPILESLAPWNEQENQ